MSPNIVVDNFNSYLILTIFMNLIFNYVFFLLIRELIF